MSTDGGDGERGVTDKNAATAVIDPEDTEDEHDNPMFETVNETDAGQIIDLHGPVLFEQSLEQTRADFEERGTVRGRVPIIDIGALTANKNRYLYEATAFLERDINRMLTSRKESTRQKLQMPFVKGQRWVSGIMYATHGPAVSKQMVSENFATEDSDRLLAIASEITGTFREGNLFGITFETLKTNAGRDIAELLMKALVPGVSLRSLPKEESPNNEGGFDVSRLEIKGFGADWTTDPSMPRASEIKLESRDNNGSEGNRVEPKDIKTLDDLKEVNPTLFESVSAKISAGEDAETALEGAKATLQAQKEKMESTDAALRKARVVLASAAAAEVKTRWETELGKDEALSDDSRKRLLETASEEIKSVAVALLDERPELEPESPAFRDAVYSKAQPKLESRVTDHKEMVAALMKEHKITPAPKIETTQAAPEGTEGLATVQAINGPDRERHLRIESENEIVGLPRTSVNGSEPTAPAFKDIINAHAFGMQMFENNDAGNPVHVLDKYMPERRAILNKIMPIYESEPFLVRMGGGHTNLSDAQWKALYGKIWTRMLRREKLEANEMTTSGVLGTLFPDFKSGLIEAAFAMAKFLSLVTVQTTGAPEYQIWEEEYTRTGQHFFGELAQVALVTTIDEGAVTWPARVFVEIKVQYDADEVITLTGTDGAGKTDRTWTVPVYTTDAVGDRREAMPVEAVTGSGAGALCIDVSAAADTDTATAGEVKIFVFDEVNTGSETAVSQNASSTLVRRTGTVEEFDLKVELTWRLIEDAFRALATTGPGRYDAIAAMTRMIASDFANSIDSRGFTALNATANFDVQLDTAKSYDISDATKTAAIHEDFVKHIERIKFWGLEQPTRTAINEGDTHKLLWMKGDFITRFQNRAEEFFRGMAWGVVGGTQIVDSFWQPHNVMMAMSPGRVFHISYIPLEFRGPFTFIASQKTDIYVGRQRTKEVFTKPKTRGRFVITET
jgi:hypothetical protein